MNLREAQIAASEASKVKGNEEKENTMEENKDQRIIPWEGMSFGQRVAEVLDTRRQEFYNFGATFLPPGSPEMVAIANRAEEVIRLQYPEYRQYHDVQQERREFCVVWVEGTEHLIPGETLPEAPPGRYEAISAQVDVVEVNPDTGELEPASGTDIDLRPSHWSEAG